MPETLPVTINVTDLPKIKAALAEAIAAERRRLVILARATCACQRCKDDVASLLAAVPAEARTLPARNEHNQSAGH